eukprot:TRINITY_DN4156_c0_g1_i3.p3 TRINITY_DN4156_c0_g1~~TRINITY_DN4156_c0_g1_i3.p3  ORF type:complete len:196 (+),score=54.05 TRINITY_DN4156_c0_g1_i3:1784-2371(+)
MLQTDVNGATVQSVHSEGETACWPHAEQEPWVQCGVVLAGSQSQLAAVGGSTNFSFTAAVAQALRIAPSRVRDVKYGASDASSSSTAIVTWSVECERTDDSSLRSWAIVLIVIAGLLVLALIGYVLYQKQRPRKITFLDLGDKTLARISEAERELNAYYDREEARLGGRDQLISMDAPASPGSPYRYHVAPCGSV